MRKYSRRESEQLLKLYRLAPDDKARHEFLQIYGGGGLFGLPAAEYPTTVPELRPCECGNADLHAEELRTMTLPDYRIFCPVCGRHTAYAGLIWTARKLWNAGEIFEPKQ